MESHYRTWCNEATMHLAGVRVKYIFKKKKKKKKKKGDDKSTPMVLVSALGMAVPLMIQYTRLRRLGYVLNRTEMFVIVFDLWPVFRDAMSYLKIAMHIAPGIWPRGADPFIWSGGMDRMVVIEDWPGGAGRRRRGKAWSGITTRPFPVNKLSPAWS